MIIAYEKLSPVALLSHDLTERLFVRCDVERDLDYDMVRSLSHLPITPILFHRGSILHPARLHDALEPLKKSHCAWAQALMHAGCKSLALAADNDGALQKILSPRFSSASLDERMKPLLELHQALHLIHPETTVLLTVEELAPGGLDPTDGITIARALEAQGLREIIATAGTKDFWPLYDRRTTQKKRQDQEDFYSNEPSLASAWWLIKHTRLRVWCLGYFDDEAQAGVLADHLGLVGLINKAPIDI